MRAAAAAACGATISAAAMAQVTAAGDDPCAPMNAMGVVCETQPVTMHRVTSVGGDVLRSDPVALRPRWLTVGCCVSGGAAAPSAFAVAAARETAMTSPADDSCLAAYFPSLAAIEASIAEGETGATFAALAGAPGMAQQDTVELRAIVGRLPDPALCGGAEGLAAWSAPLEDAEIVGSGILLFFQVEVEPE